MQQKKIVLVSPAYPYRGGQALVEAYMFHMLSGMGYDCHTISYKLLYPSLFFPGTTQYDRSEIIPFDHREKIKHIINSVNPFTWITAANEIKKLKPDAVIFVWWMPFFGPALGTIARTIRKRCKIIFLVENYVSHEKRWFDSFATKNTLRYADAFITESSYITRQIAENFAGKPVHQATLSIYDCYDLDRYTKQSAKSLLSIKDKNVVLFFGLIRPYKGLAKLILAFKELLKTRPDTTLLVAGECYDDEKKYRDIIKSENLQNKVSFINKFIPNEQVELYFKAADVVCLPYESGTQSGVLMMAYGFKVPVVVTDVGGIAELVKDGKTGKIIADNSAAQLVPALEEILKNPHNENYAANIASMTEELGYKGMQTYIEELLK